MAKKPDKQLVSLSDVKAEKLDSLSIDQLMERIRYLNREIRHTEQELKEKDTDKQILRAIFKR